VVSDERERERRRFASADNDRGIGKGRRVRQPRRCDLQSRCSPRAGRRSP
jgi:hypothetical protein